jgi:hypothetical protein
MVFGIVKLGNPSGVANAPAIANVNAGFGDSGMGINNAFLIHVYSA